MEDVGHHRDYRRLARFAEEPAGCPFCIDTKVGCLAPRSYSPGACRGSAIYRGQKTEEILPTTRPSLGLRAEEGSVGGTDEAATASDGVPVPGVDGDDR